jgi:TRAP-type uncharacterized transport system substrate-binding protein
LARLYNEEVHLLAGKGIEKVQDLAGKRVNFGNSGSSNYMTAKVIFDSLKISVQPEILDQGSALEKVANGELAAMVYVAGKPTELFSKVERRDDLHFLPIPLEPDVAATYLPASLTHKDYPTLIGTELPVETVAVGAVLAVYNWPRNSEQYRKIDAFIGAFFGSLDEFQKPPRHPRWQEFNLAATVPGWNRLPAADAWLKTHAKPAFGAAPDQRELRDKFQAFLKFLEDNKMIASSTALSEQERAQLFARFLQWQERQGQ